MLSTPPPDVVRTQVHFKGGPLDGQDRWLDIVTAKYVVMVGRTTIEECHDLATDSSWEVQRDEVTENRQYVYYLRGTHHKGRVGYTYHLTSSRQLEEPVE